MWFSYSIQLIMNIISEPTHLEVRAAHGFDFFLYEECFGFIGLCIKNWIGKSIIPGTYSYVKFSGKGCIVFPKNCHNN